MTWEVRIRRDEKGEKILLKAPGEHGVVYGIEPSDAMDLLHNLIVSVSQVQHGYGHCGTCGGTTALVRKYGPKEPLYRIQCAGCGNRSAYMTEEQLRAIGAYPIGVRR